MSSDTSLLVALVVGSVILLIVCLLVLILWRRVSQKSCDDDNYNKTKEADLDMMESEDEYSTTDQEEWKSDKQFSGGNYLMVDILDISYSSDYNIISDWITQ